MNSSQLRRQIVVAGHTGQTRLALDNLDHADPTLRAAAMSALHRLGSLATAHLETGLTDEAAEVRRRAAELAAHYETPDLATALNDSEPTVVEAAAWALGERSAPSNDEFVALCRVAANHDDAICREAAVAALGAIGDPRALDTILQATGDKAAVRRRATLALAPFDGPAVDEAIERALHDRDWQVRQAAEDMLG